MNYKVKCTGYEQNREKYFTVGKVYEVVNNSITADNGFCYKDDKDIIEWLSLWYTFEKIGNTQKIVITSDGVETLARLYDGNKVIKTATAKCSPADTFDFEVGASLAYDRLMKKTVPPTFSEGVKTACEAIKNACKDTEAKQKWRVVKDRDVRVGDYIRLTYKGYSFDEVGDILKVDCTLGQTAQVYGRNHKRETRYPDLKWSYKPSEYEIIEPVPKYKAGDKVKVIRNTCYHSMEIGEVVTLEKTLFGISNTSWFVKEYKMRCYINESDFELYAEPKKPKYFNGKVVCVEKKTPWGAYTVGKVYEIKDGYVVIDNGNKLPEKPIKNVEEWYSYSEKFAKFIPIVE